MQFGSWVDLYNRACNICKQPLMSEPPQSLIFEHDEWTHEKCLLKAKKALALAMRLARLGSAINEYIYYREDISAP